MKQELDSVGLIAGPGLFLYGMRQLGSGLKSLAGGSFRRLLQQSTQHRPTPVTACLEALDRYQ